MIGRWSFSRLQVYEGCARRAQLQYLERLPEIRRPDGNKAADRGTWVHQAAEDFVLGKRHDLIPELHNFKQEFMHLRNIDPKTITAEHTWYFDDEWNPVAHQKDAWLTVIIDLNVWLTDYTCITIDHKTGKRYGNEVKHGQQLQLYQLATLLRYPDTQEVTTELWYHDQNEIAKQTYTRKQGLRFLNHFHNRGVALTTDTKFKAKPSTYSCRFCPYRTGQNKWVCGTGDCDLNPPDNTEEPRAVWIKNKKLLTGG